MSLEQIVYSATVNRIQRSESGEVSACHVRVFVIRSNNITHFVGVVLCNYRLTHGRTTNTQNFSLYVINSNSFLRDLDT
jgi:hypothetical protein